MAALEVLIVTSAISNLIREAKTFQIQSMMQVGKAVGMVTLNDALMDLVTKKLITPEEGYAKAIDKAGMETDDEAGRDRPVEAGSGGAAGGPGAAPPGRAPAGRLRPASTRG